MKKSILILFMGVIGMTVFAQEEKAIEDVIRSFAKAADKNDTEKLATYLDDNYRIVMNRLFGAEGVSIVTKEDYLAKIESKEWGGDKRTVTIEKITVNGNSASAHVTLKGEKATFISLFMLIKDAEGNWKLVSDTPTIG